MSLGWLTESSLIPKEPKPIKGIGTASLLNLQAAVYEREQRGLAPSAKKRRLLAEKSARNEGVDARNARDADQTVGEQAGSELVKARLAEKARRYDAMASGRAAGDQKEEPLVDFQRKTAEAAASMIDQHFMAAPMEQNAFASHLFETYPDGANAVFQEEQVNPGAVFLSAAVAPPACLVDGTVLQPSHEWHGEFPPPPDGLPGESLQGEAFPGDFPPPPTEQPVGPVPTPFDFEVPKAPPASARSITCQAFERPLSTVEDLQLRERIHEETEHARDTLGRERKEAREGVRSRLAALRAAKANN